MHHLGDDDALPLENNPSLGDTADINQIRDQAPKLLNLTFHDFPDEGQLGVAIFLQTQERRGVGNWCQGISKLV
jgi:hypothetical protein